MSSFSLRDKNSSKMSLVLKKEFTPAGQKLKMEGKHESVSL